MSHLEIIHPITQPKSYILPKRKLHRLKEIKEACDKSRCVIDFLKVSVFAWRKEGYVRLTPTQIKGLALSVSELSEDIGCALALFKMALDEVKGTKDAYSEQYLHLDEVFVLVVPAHGMAAFINKCTSALERAEDLQMNWSQLSGVLHILEHLHDYLLEIEAQLSPYIVQDQPKKIKGVGDDTAKH